MSADQEKIGSASALSHDHDLAPSLVLVLPRGLSTDQAARGIAQVIGQVRTDLTLRALQFRQHAASRATTGDAAGEALCRGQALASDHAAGTLDEAIVEVFSLWDQYERQIQPWLRLYASGSASGSAQATKEREPMIDTTDASQLIADDDSREAVRRMRAIEAGFTAHGLTTHLTDARAGLDLTAVLSPSAKREPEIWIDEEGYAELRYWNPPGASPAEVAATALRALAAVTTTPTDSGAPHARQEGPAGDDPMKV
jgi:hypothetical protein